VTTSDIITAILLPGLAGLAIWYYPHCARPPLAFASMPRVAFLVCIALTGFIVAGCALLWVGLYVDLLGREVSRLVSGLMLVAWVPLSVALIRPGWFRVLGPPDPTAQPRFLLTWFRKEWYRLDGDGQRVGFVEMFERELEKIREPSNAAFVDVWIQALRAFVHGHRLGHTSSERERLTLDGLLDAIVPVDPIARWI
jgi:hypothetical protein